MNFVIVANLNGFVLKLLKRINKKYSYDLTDLIIIDITKLYDIKNV